MVEIVLIVFFRMMVSIIQIVMWRYHVGLEMVGVMTGCMNLVNVTMIVVIAMVMMIIGPFGPLRIILFFSVFFGRCSSGILKFDANPPPPMGVENPNTLRLAV